MITPEGKHNESIILVELNGDDSLVKAQKYYVAGNKTNMEATLFDERTQMWSDNAVYKGPKGLYIKKGGKRYLLEDFK